jgi:hypothetical protein
MTTTTNDRTGLTITEAMQRLAALDLTMVRMKLSDPVEGKGWTSDELDLAEREYRRFLALNLAHPEESIVPCEVVDVVWHGHILDTAAYAEDCARVFGFFLHHFPYFGLRGPDDAAQLVDAYDRTIELYTDAFGEPPAGVWRPEAAMKCKRTACKRQKCT